MPSCPTTRATWFNNDLVHHALVQPYTPDSVDRCDLLVACCGFERCVTSVYLGPYDAMVTCIQCLGTNWEATVAEMDRKGYLTQVENLETDGQLHRILMEGKAFAESALQPSPASRWR
jgi:hypothetical protein